MSPSLKVYVSENCWGCVEARKIVDELRVEFPGVCVDIVERNESGEDNWPESIIATPTYELDGKVVSLGNPYREDLHKLLAAAMQQTSI